MASILNGCQEGKATAKLVEVFCPECGGEMEVFEHMGSDRAGKTDSDEVCPECGYVIPRDTLVSGLQKI